MSSAISSVSRLGVAALSLLWLALVWLITALPPARAASPGQTMLVVGDSLSAGYGITQTESWVSLLRDRLQSKGYGYAVVNASISGDTTTGGLKRLPRALELHRPKVVIIELGGNDGLRGTPIKVIRDNLARMIELSKAAGAEVVLAGMQIPTNYGSSYTRSFARIYPELAQQYGVSLVEFFLDGVALEPSLIQADGIHPTAAAQPMLLNNVWPVLEGTLQTKPPGAKGMPATPRPPRAVSPTVTQPLPAG